MSNPAYTITNDAITVVLEGQPRTLKRGADNFEALREALLDEQWDAVPNLLKSQAVAIIDGWKTDEEGFTVVNGMVTFGAETLPSDLNGRIMRMAKEGADPRFLMRFWRRLIDNPSWRSVHSLWQFLQHEGIPIEADGRFLAYKSVQSNWMDHHSGTIENKPGAVIKMRRNQISDDLRVECHEGLHVGALSYARVFGRTGSRILVVRVDPVNVVCVPYDSSFYKMRVCEYEVVGLYNGDLLPSTVVTDEDLEAPIRVYGDDYEEDDYEEDDYEEDDYEEDDYEEDDYEESLVPPKVPVTKSNQIPAPPSHEWSRLDALDAEGLDGEKIGLLRKYARHHLSIVRASKIPGGKSILIEKIIEARG